MFWIREISGVPSRNQISYQPHCSSVSTLCCQRSVFSRSISIVGHNVGKIRFDCTNTYSIPKAILMCVSVLAHEDVTMPSHMPAATAQFHHWISSHTAVVLFWTVWSTNTWCVYVWCTAWLSVSTQNILSCFCGFPQTLQENAKTLSQMIPWLCPTPQFPMNYSLLVIWCYSLDYQQCH